MFDPFFFVFLASYQTKNNLCMTPSIPGCIRVLVGVDEDVVALGVGGEEGDDGSRLQIVSLIRGCVIPHSIFASRRASRVDSAVMEASMDCASL